MTRAMREEVLVFNVVVPAGGLQARKKLERALLEWLDGAEQRRRFVLCGREGRRQVDSGGQVCCGAG